MPKWIDALASVIGYAVLTFAALAAVAVVAQITLTRPTKWVLRVVFILLNPRAYRAAGMLRRPRFWLRAPGDWPRIQYESKTHARARKQPWKWAIWR